MRGLILVLFCAVYSAQAWNEIIGPIHVKSRTGNVPAKYYPLTADDKKATSRAASFVNFIKILPLVNPLQLPSLGPYTVNLHDIDFHGNILLSNIVVNGLKNLQLPELEMRMHPSRIDFNATIPHVTAEAHFHVDGILAHQSIDVNGQFSVVIKNGALSEAIGTVITAYNRNSDSERFKLSGGDVTIDVQEVQLQLNMNQHSEEFRVIIKQFLLNPHRYQKVVDDLHEDVLDAVSIELAKIPAKEILLYLKTGQQNLIG